MQRRGFRRGKKASEIRFDHYVDNLHRFDDRPISSRVLDVHSEEESFPLHVSPFLAEIASRLNPNRKFDTWDLEEKKRLLISYQYVSRTETLEKSKRYVGKKQLAILISLRNEQWNPFRRQLEERWLPKELLTVKAFSTPSFTEVSGVKLPTWFQCRTGKSAERGNILKDFHQNGPSVFSFAQTDRCFIKATHKKSGEEFGLWTTAI